MIQIQDIFTPFALSRKKREIYPVGIQKTQYPVMQLTDNERLKAKNHILITDRYYSSVNVLNYLRENGFGFLGAIMTIGLILIKRSYYQIIKIQQEGIQCVQ